MKLTTFKKEDGATLLENTPWDEAIDAKELPFDEKVEFLKFCLSDAGLCNVSVLANIAVLVRGSSLKENEFESPDIMFKSLEEYIDVKQELLDEVKIYRNELAKYYLASLKSMSVVLPDGKVDIPKSYFGVLMTLDLDAVGKIVHGAELDFNTLPSVNMGKEVVYNIAGKNALFDEVCKILIKSTKQ